LMLSFEHSMPANTDQYSLDFESALDVEARVVDSITTGYDRVIAIGSHATSTCTLSFDTIYYQLRKDWTDAAIADYATAASGDADYAALDPLKKAERNTRYRQKDKLRAVLRRWRIYEWWDGLVHDYEIPLASCTFYYFNPKWTDDKRDTDPLCVPIQPYSRTLRDPGAEFWPAGTKILPRMMLQDKSDYSGTKIATGAFTSELADGDQATYLPPLVFVRTDTTSSPNRYELIERLSEQSSNETVRRRWSANVHILSEEASIEINCTGAPQHFLGRGLNAALAQVEAFLDASKEQGIDFEDIRGTFALQLPWRVQQRVEITDEADIVPGKPWRTLYIPVDARLDYVVPDTVVAVENGRPVLSTGGFVRDDRLKLFEIAQAAAIWYGTVRQTLFLRIKGVVDIVPVGALITDVGGTYNFEDINTVVSSVTYDLLHQETTIETSFAEIEFS